MQNVAADFRPPYWIEGWFPRTPVWSVLICCLPWPLRRVSPQALEMIVQPMMNLRQPLRCHRGSRAENESARSDEILMAKLKPPVSPPLAVERLVARLRVHPKPSYSPSHLPISGSE